MIRQNVAYLAGLVLCVMFLSPLRLQASEAEQIKREQAFEQLLTGSVLVGHFSIDGKELTDSAPERYEIESVKKFQNDLWIFTARIKYGKTDLKVPMTLKVVWAGDTPMISMTEVSIVPLGTFTSRVFFYDDRYAGTWQHGKVGGHMWGKIEKQKPSTDESKPAQ